MRILQVSDVFSALVEKRPYRDAVSLNEAIEILEKEASFKKLDSQVCKKLKELINNGYLDEFFTNRFTHVLEDLFELKFNEIDTIFERDFDGWEGLF
jgi:HD-GYP domain-containing protein (c-di-GMP phosphodiesterase class II)